MPETADRAILCVDLDAFFVSVERLLDPRLEGRPVVVGGEVGSRGVVAAASYEARAYGVRSAMPVAEAGRRLRGVPGTVFMPPSRGAYGEHSARVRALLDAEVPAVETASIDEFYGDATALGDRPSGEPLALAERILSRIRGECGLPVSIGIAGSKLVSKIATDEAKPRGILRVLAGREPAFLSGLPIERIPGIGPKTAPRLHAIGVREIGAALVAPREALESVLGRGGASWLLDAARGIDPSPVAESAEARSIGHEETFDRDISSLAELERIATGLAERVGFRLRAERLAARTVTLKIRYGARRGPYQVGLAREAFETSTRARTGPATDDGLEIAQVARDLLREHWRPGEPLRLLGVSASRFASKERQGSLFEGGAERAARDARLTRALDEVRERFGFDAIGRASALKGHP